MKKKIPANALIGGLIVGVMLVAAVMGNCGRRTIR